MTSQPPDPEGSIRQLALEGAALLETDGELTLLREKQWANSTIWTYGDQETPRVVVKMGRAWTGRDATDSFHRSARLYEAIQREERARDFLSTPRPLALSESPPAVCFEYVPGEDGAPVLAKLMNGSWKANLSRLEELVRSWGHCLAAYHLVEAHAVTETKEAEAKQFLQRMCRAFGLSWQRLRGLSGSRAFTRCLDDPGFHNLRLGERGELCLLDLSPQCIVRTIHYDLANALAWLDDAYRDAPLNARSQLRQSLSSALLDGYSQFAGTDLRSPENSWWTLLNLTWARLHWARTALRRRHFAQTLVNLYRAFLGVVSLHRYPHGDNVT